MAKGTCIVDGCANPVRCKRLCESHYRKSRRSPRLTVDERYERNVDRSAGWLACHPWTASTNRAGYGMFAHDGETLAARWAYKRYVGLLFDGIHIRHTCDNPPCQNRQHWVIGNNAANQSDKLMRNRQHRPVGEKNVKAKLTQDQVLAIRQKHPVGVRGVRYCAAEYGVCEATIRNILRRETWKHI